MWQENILHVALSTATNTFLWWQSGSQQPLGIGLDELVDVMDELENVLAATAHRLNASAGSCAPLEPLTKRDNRTWIRQGRSSPSLLSGMRVRCGNEKMGSLYRYTLRCEDVSDGFAQYCSTAPAGMRHGSQQVT